MNRGDYNTLQGWTLPEGQDASDEGYLVEYLDGGKANHPDFENYISWSPKDVFEAAYCKTGGMNLGLAIVALEKGFKVARAGWNGKDMWLTYSPGFVNLSAEKFWSTHNREYAEQNGGKATVCPSVMIKNANGTISYWQPSSGDMFAKDWYIVN